MASQPITAAAVVEIHSYMRGYHAYQEKWNPMQGDVLQLVREPTNATDKLAVAIIKNGHVVHCTAIGSVIGLFFKVSNKQREQACNPVNTVR